VNEFVAGVFLRYLGIAAPEMAIVNIDRSFLENHPEVHLKARSHSIEVEPGWHFGSRYPGDPGSVSVYDFLPDSLLSKVINIDHFRAILVFDKWIGNMDGRQCIFYRGIVQRGTESPGQPGFVAQMIDNGHAFNGSNWDFPESAVQGIYARTQVYGPIRTLDDFQPWLAQVVNFPEEVFDDAWKSIPRQWLDADEDDLDRLLESLYRRRRRVPDLLSASLGHLDLITHQPPCTGSYCF